ncbi:3-methyladenine DNA glycosylase [Candidatus Kaiserbacteria bacterium CG10_big_fil_rev_8_21_14_0_10_51_14]|uniref:Putative 3-methyladenine DNA glycosylase n=1 Tax=Candidatus Kaiserbacteria bacterium CG10_big_fil_rev_8_21_14_0_10_51_14 TaxID=1974610 RepID=A0A2H0UCD0_9BACT|nr:MAG: 3-methyladenine DNA glycosylase [Candidatus Kaiserbacteria bacterium CG10_big_fil_rev_8_21_14_0_10_51_14]
MQKVLEREFFDRSPLVVARDLIGKYLVRRVGAKQVAFMITETEGYGGWHDLASHSRSGKTTRNAPMFAEAGTIYVYFTYGMHWMLNLVCGKEGYPAAVLIRGVASASWRISGPARLTKAMGINKDLNGKTLGKQSGLWVEDRGVKISSRKIKRTPRIGIAYAGEWAHKPWRFVLEPN